MREKLAIVGSHPETREQFDWNRTDCDVWVFNEAMSQLWVKRADAVFQLHAPVIFRNPGNRNDSKHYEWLKSGDTPPIYMQEAYEDIPKAVKYPLEDICQKLLPNLIVNDAAKAYFTSSVAFAIALGIYQGYRHMEIYGVEMETDTEYKFQRDGVTFWLGYALGLGIHVEVYTKQLFRAAMYGYEGDVTLDYDYFIERIKVLEENTRLAQAEYERARDEADMAMDSFVSAGKDPQVESVVEAIRKQITMANNFGIVDGARQENARYKKKADVMKATSGGEFVFCRQEFEQAGQALMKEREKSLSLANTYALQLGKVFDELAKINYSDKRRRLKAKEFDPVLRSYVTESTKLGMFMGAAIENKRHLDKLTDLIRAAGGSKSEAVMLEALQMA